MASRKSVLRAPRHRTSTVIKAPERILVAGPSITDREVELVAEAARTAWFANHQTYNTRFERAVADYVGVKHAVSVPHCTAALHLILAGSGVGPGDEVIVPDITWIASVVPVTYVGAEPVLVDSLPSTWCIDPAAVEAAIGPKTKAIIGVDLYGSMCDWDALQRIADKHNLVLIEDSAEALGSSYHGRRAGSFGRAAAFSFHGSKTVVTGEGGMLVTSDDKLKDRVLFLRDHGRRPGDRNYINEEICFKYRMSAVTAALGVAQMERIDELITRKRQIFSWYKEGLAGVAGITLNAEPEGTTNSYWMVTAIVDASYGMDKFAVMAAFDQRNIDARPFFTPLFEQPAFAARGASKRFVTPNGKGHLLARYGINLPSGYHMTSDKVALVSDAFREILAQKG
jgi:perosamine synthetase